MHKSELVALIDMDGTLCDYEGAMRRDLERLRSPGDPAVFPDDDLAVIVLSNAEDHEPQSGPYFAPVPEAMVREVIDAYFLHRIFPAASGAK